MIKYKRPAALLPLVFGLVFLLVVVGGGCAVGGRKGLLDSIKAADLPNASFIEGVPYLPQRGILMCGPAALASVMRYYGADVRQEEIAGAVYSPRIKGALTMDLLLYAKERGFRAEYYSGGLDDLRQRVRDGTPIIAFLNLGFDLYPVGHYVVVVGFSDEQRVVVAHWGTEKEKVVGYERFLKAWEKTGFSTLLVTPGE